MSDTEFDEILDDSFISNDSYLKRESSSNIQLNTKPSLDIDFSFDDEMDDYSNSKTDDKFYYEPDDKDILDDDELDSDLI